MNTATIETDNAKPRRKIAQAKSAPRTFATHQELLDDMAAFRMTVSATPGAARAFLIKAGLLTKSGKPRQLIRD